MQRCLFHRIRNPQERRIVEGNLDYIADPEIKELARHLLATARMWHGDNLGVDPIKGSISLKVNGKVSAYLSRQRKAFLVEYFDEAGAFVNRKVSDKETLANAVEDVKGSFDSKIG